MLRRTIVPGARAPGRGDAAVAVHGADGMVTFESPHDEPRMHGPRVLEVRRRIDLVGDEELKRVIP